VSDQIEHTDSTHWGETSVDVTLQSGPKSVRAATHDLAPGLAVTMCGFGWFEVTTQATGNKISARYERFASAARDMLQAALMAKTYGFRWEDVKHGSDLEPHFGKPVPFDGYYTISDGEKKPLTFKDWIVTMNGGLSDDEFPWEEEGPWDALAVLEDQLQEADK